ncbi:hypothetical protein P872_05480 [Rhodonellum psychrophilum GCM71 = DSM 17998]|uniref:Carboxypeptidase-like regulatory domain-containing protein n=2 Tax=Rhodonellum TaxID=336827 RepID=U5BYJ0_9BACT|nr:MULTISPECIES: hypothetical protein [Rhodonellum]ERM82898.1 hypothetical protein P872_05480 [Rhodonellum psychrophilum GCM71 = DSM 17998]SDY47494.1 hypothetical protein SAMN05444412_101266 [Rhodonellum ikkaensis]
MQLIFILLALWGIALPRVHGIVKDRDGRPIPSVLVASGDHFSVSNNSGEFTVLLNEDRNLTFQSLGFFTKDFLVKDPEQPIEIIMESLTYELPEFELVSLTAHQIVENSAALFWKAYHWFPSTTRYEYGNEVVIHSGSTKKEAKRFAVFDRYKAHVRKGFPQFSIHDMQVEDSSFWKENENLILNNGFWLSNNFFYEAGSMPSFFFGPNMKKYAYELDGEFENHYRILVKSKSNRQHEDGEIWIDKHTFKIQKITVWKNEKGLRAYFLTSNLASKNLAGISAHLKEETIHFELDEVDSKYVIKNVSHKRRIQMDFKGQPSVTLVENSKLNLLTILSKTLLVGTGFQEQTGSFFDVWANPNPYPGLHGYRISFDK